MHPTVKLSRTSCKNAFAWDPDKRPSAREIVGICRDALHLYDRLEFDRNDPGYNDLAGIARNEPPVGYDLNEQGQTPETRAIDERLPHAVVESDGSDEESSDDELLFHTGRRTRTLSLSDRWDPMPETP